VVRTVVGIAAFVAFAHMSLGFG